MSYGTPDVYYQAEHFGLLQIGEIQWSEPDYSFDIGVVWVDTAGTLYYGQDSGCSCPSPFEDFTSLDDLEKFETVAALQERLDKENEEHYAGYGANEEKQKASRAADIVDILIKAQALVTKIKEG